MPLEVKFANSFVKSAKPLSKKYRSFEQDPALLISKIISGEESGQPLGQKVSKHRLAIKSKNKGKSGGARVISLEEVEIITTQDGDFDGKITLLYIYDKSEKESVSDHLIKSLIEDYLG